MCVMGLSHSHWPVTRSAVSHMDVAIEVAESSSAAAAAAALEADAAALEVAAAAGCMLLEITRPRGG